MTNEKNEIVTSTLEEANKLTTFLLFRILKSIDQADSMKTEPTVIAKYLGILKKLFGTICNNKTINCATLLIPRLLFKDLRVLDNFSEFYCSAKTPIFCTYNQKEFENWIEVKKKDFINFYKVLLKELNLMKFYEYCMEIGGNEIDKNSFEPVNVMKTTDINGFLYNVANVLFAYDSRVLQVYTGHHYKSKFKDVSPIIFYMSFYCWIKMINSLLNQYKKVMDNKELQQKINTRVFTHLSVILIVTCLGKIMHTVTYLLTYCYLYKNTPVKSISMGDLEKLLVKINEIFDKVYSTLFKEKKENMKLLIANYEENPPVDLDVRADIINPCFNKYIKEFWEYIYDDSAPIENEELKRILEVSENICFLGYKITCEIYKSLQP
jgi:hypothetical protein